MSKNKNNQPTSIIGLILLIGIGVAGITQKPQTPTTAEASNLTVFQSKQLKSREELDLSQTQLDPNRRLKDDPTELPPDKDDLIQKTQKYIETYFHPKQNSSPNCKNTLVTAKEWVEIAQENDFPLDLLIVQAHLESHGGTCGRANISKNVHNVNNTDGGDTMPVTICGVYTECLDNWLVGEQKFINLIKHCYTKKGKKPNLMDFINQDFRVQQTVPPYCSVKEGSRYMTDTRAREKYLETLNKNYKPIFG